MSVVKFKNKGNSSQKIELLDELIPNIKKYAGETFVIYYNGQALYDPKLAAKFSHDVVLMRQFGINIIIVHGGEQIIDNLYKEFNLDSTYVRDIRVIDKRSIMAVEMALSGFVNKNIVSNINDAGGVAIGISGKDASLIEARKYRGSFSQPDQKNVEELIDFGFVGEPRVINPDILLTFEDSEVITVIAPIARGESGETFQLDSLTTAAVISSSLVVSKFIIIDDCEKTNDLLSQSGGPSIDYNSLCDIAKSVKGEAPIKHILNTCICVLQNKVDSINIIDGKIAHGIIFDIFTNDKCGILIENE